MVMPTAQCRPERVGQRGRLVDRRMDAAVVADLLQQRHVGRERAQRLGGALGVEAPSVPTQPCTFQLTTRSACQAASLRLVGAAHVAAQ